MTPMIFRPTVMSRQAGRSDGAKRSGSNRAPGSSTIAARKRSSEGSVMARTVRRLLSIALFLGWFQAVPAARSQTPSTPSGPASALAPAPRADVSGMVNDVIAEPLGNSTPLTPGNQWEPAFLQFLPQPPDAPASLFAAPPAPGPPPPNLEKYFEVDPILDNPRLGQKPGWFSDVQVQAIHPVLNFGQMRLLNPISVGGHSATIAPGANNLLWTVAPRLEIGYWLPSGFGGFSFSDRFFSTYGTGPFSGPAGSTFRSTRLGANYSDWDYISREFTPWGNDRVTWNMEWRAGVRLAESWSSTVVDKPFATAASTNGIFIQGASNYMLGAGPHFALELNRKHLPSGIMFYARVDIADEFSRIRQDFQAASTTLDMAGVPVRGSFTQNFWSQVPILNYQVGMGWQPPSHPNVRFFVGYLYEYWWQMASNMEFLNPYANQGATRGSMNNQGLVFRCIWNW
jgi:hypothetical protein